MAELADALALGASVTDVQVQVLSPAPKSNFNRSVGIAFFVFTGLEPLVDGAQTSFEYKYTTMVDLRCDL